MQNGVWHRPGTKGESRRLLVIIGDRLSTLLAKGEIVARYYNPENVFDEIHILMINDDRVSVKDVQSMAGTANVFLHNLPRPSVLATCGWRPWLLWPWSQQAVALAQTIRPHLVRCYANWLNGIAGMAVKHSLGVPLVVSVHIDADRAFRKLASWRRPKEKMLGAMSEALESLTLRSADMVIGVYEAASAYARRRGARRVETIYNAVNGEHATTKSTYTLSRPPRIVCVSRQFVHKNPENVIRACQEVGAQLTLIGDGPYHQRLRKIAWQIGGSSTFVNALPNDALCQALHEYDAFAAHSSYNEVSKAVLEAMLVGLPIVVNTLDDDTAPELKVGGALLVPDSTEGYASAFRRLFGDESLRRAVGHCGKGFVARRCDPRIMEARVAQIYREALDEVPGRTGG